MGSVDMASSRGSAFQIASASSASNQGADSCPEVILAAVHVLRACQSRDGDLCGAGRTPRTTKRRTARSWKTPAACSNYSTPGTTGAIDIDDTSKAEPVIGVLAPQNAAGYLIWEWANPPPPQ